MSFGPRSSSTGRPLAGTVAVLVLVFGCSAQGPTGPNVVSAPGGTATTASPKAGASAQAIEARAASGRPNLRRLTVVVRVKPPPILAQKYKEFAAGYKDLERFFLAQADGGFGSGFIVVRRSGITAGGERPLVVTNLHVMGLSTDASISFEGSKETFAATLLYADPTYDLAVLGFYESAPPLTSPGLELELAAAEDQQAVVASGYPGIGGEPSYQVTRGYVSNERFRLTEGGREQTYVQHTAPIDSGSSGGPLTTEEGKLLGVNTFKVRWRENVGLAIPSSIVENALERAMTEPPRADPSSSESSRAACEELARALSRGEEALSAIERAIGAEMIARDGYKSLDKLPRDEHDWALRFAEDPASVFAYAIALRLLGTAKASSPKLPGETCTAHDAATTTSASFRVKVGGGERTWKFAWEQRRWKLVEGALTGGGAGDGFLRGIGAKTPKRKWKPTLK